MKKTLLFSLAAVIIGFTAGYMYKDMSLYAAVAQHPRGELNIPSQWLMEKSTVGWERVMLIFGYADNVSACSHLVADMKAKWPDGDFRCTDAN